MTVSSTSNRAVYSGDGSTSVFPFAFKVPTAADLTVIYTDATGTDFTLSSGQYSATGFNVDAGGTVTYLPSGSAIALGTKLTIYRSIAPTQPTSISNQGAMWPQVIEATFDRLTMIVQGFIDGFNRCLRISPSDGATLNPLPNATLRANSVLGFDGSGQPYAATLTGSLVAASNWLITNFFPMSSAAAARGSIGAAGLVDDNAFSGTNTFPTQAAGDKTTKASTTAFAQAAVAARTAVADANASPTDATRTIVFTSLTAARTVVLPAASGITAGRTYDIIDGSGSASATNTISLVPNGTDTIAGSNTTQVCINIPRGRCRLVCNGANGWDVEVWSVTYVTYLGSDVSLTNTSNFFDGPSVTQGTVGTWRVIAGVTAGDTAAASIYAKLWDDTTVISSGAAYAAVSSGWSTIFLEGQITNPAANLKVSAKDATATSGKIKADATGGAKDSYIRATRIA